MALTRREKQVGDHLLQPGWEKNLGRTLDHPGAPREEKAIEVLRVSVGIGAPDGSPEAAARLGVAFSPAVRDPERWGFFLGAIIRQMAQAYAGAPQPGACADCGQSLADPDAVVEHIVKGIFESLHGSLDPFPVAEIAEFLRMAVGLDDDADAEDGVVPEAVLAAMRTKGSA